MELEVLDRYIIKSCGSLNEHNELVEEKIKKLKPEYYTVETELIRLSWRTTITVMEAKGKI